MPEYINDAAADDELAQYRARYDDIPPQHTTTAAPQVDQPPQVPPPPPQTQGNQGMAQEARLEQQLPSQIGGGYHQPHNQVPWSQAQHNGADAGIRQQQAPAPQPHPQAPQPGSPNDPRRAQGGPVADTYSDGDYGYVQQSASATAARNDSASLKSEDREQPKMGWQAKVAKMKLPVRKGKDETWWDNQISKINTPYGKNITIVIIGGKGSSGKTVTAINLGTAIAEHRMNSNVVAITIDPAGNIHKRIRPVGEGKPRSLNALVELARSARARGRSQPEKYAVSALMLTNNRKLSVLGAARSDAAPPLTPQIFGEAIDVLTDAYNVTIIDTGNDPNADVYHQALAAADVLIGVTSMEKDQIDGLMEELDALHAHGAYQKLLRSPLIVFNTTKSGQVDIIPKNERQRIRQRHQGAEVVPVGWDKHVHRGDKINPDSLDKQTHWSFLRLAASAIQQAVK